jgi:hypothetical protein
LKQHLQVSVPTAQQSSTAAGDKTHSDIEYHPDRVKWQARTARRLAADPSLATTALPEGFPKTLNSPLVWEGTDWKDEKQWVYELSAAELKEIDDAVKHFHGGLYIFRGLCSQALTQ